MYNSFLLFKNNIADVKGLSEVHRYLEATISSPFSFDDLLRSQIVYSVSAFDKLMHDLIRVGMVQIFKGARPPTPKYLAEPIPMELHREIATATFPPKEHLFENAVFNKLKIISYQDPSKISEGLSYIWNESQKWQKISENLPFSDKDMKVKLKLIAGRRNSIVHEADIDPVTLQKYEITQTDCDEVTEFLYSCGSEIYKLVS
ncbi:HEPN domain-containing protein [Saccharospirillum alexandrii]|uniref:HEPN domain-containing protein n=1 Tax=Saccharospirillum alexandrii TaxID=2448477 RepID=UPI000FD95B3B|nr:HEPN domain-containing protein [Saccharospirillum alexandrii]